MKKTHKMTSAITIPMLECVKFKDKFEMFEKVLIFILNIFIIEKVKKQLTVPCIILYKENLLIFGFISLAQEKT